MDSALNSFLYKSLCMRMCMCMCMCMMCMMCMCMFMCMCMCVCVYVYVYDVYVCMLGSGVFLLNLQPHHCDATRSAGLYLVSQSENASQSLLCKLRIGLDFLLFVKQCLAKGAIPALNWDYSKLLKAAPRLLNKPFAKQGDAIQKYGGENVFDVASGWRSLRWTAEHVYGTNVQNPAFSSDPVYLRIKAEIYRVLPIHLDQPVLPGMHPGYQVRLPDSPQQQAALKRLMALEPQQDADEAKREELEELFSDVGGLSAWRAMISAIRFI